MAQYIDQIYVDGNDRAVVFSLNSNGQVIAQFQCSLANLEYDLANAAWNAIASQLDANRVIFSWDAGIRVDYAYNEHIARQFAQDDEVIAIFDAGINGNNNVNFNACVSNVDFALSKAFR